MHLCMQHGGYAISCMLSTSCLRVDCATLLEILTVTISFCLRVHGQQRQQTPVHRQPPPSRGQQRQRHGPHRRSSSSISSHIMQQASHPTQHRPHSSTIPVIHQLSRPAPSVLAVVFDGPVTLTEVSVIAVTELMFPPEEIRSFTKVDVPM